MHKESEIRKKSSGSFLHSSWQQLFSPGLSSLHQMSPKFHRAQPASTILTQDGWRNFKSVGRSAVIVTRTFKKIKKWLETNEETFDAENKIAKSDQPFSANGSIPDDGCASTSVRFDDGNCYPLMGRKPCGDPQQWVTVDPETFKVCKLKCCPMRAANNCGD